MIKFIVPAGHKEQKLRYFLASYGKISTNLGRKIKWHGNICINDNPVCAANAFVKAGDIITYDLNDNSSSITPCQKPLDIVYEDEWLLIINKPADLVIHPTSKIYKDTLVNIVAGYYLQTHKQAGCHPVYRLDRNTTGLIIIAKQPQIQYYLSASHGRICRFYQAVVSGCPTPKEAMLCMPIGRKPGSIIERMVTPAGQPALTRYKVLQTMPERSLITLQLYTGRTHQIRVHMAADGHPLLGDDLYGGDCALISRQALHASRLIFTHPMSGKKFDLSVPLPMDMRKLL